MAMDLMDTPDSKAYGSFASTSRLDAHVKLQLSKMLLRHVPLLNAALHMCKAWLLFYM